MIVQTYDCGILLQTFNKLCFNNAIFLHGLQKAFFFQGKTKHKNPSDLSLENKEAIFTLTESLKIFCKKIFEKVFSVQSCFILLKCPH